MRTNTISIIIIIILTFVGINPTFTQTKDDDCKYDCWVEKAKESLKNDRFVDAAYRFAAAQACDDAPVPDTLDAMIEKIYKKNTAFIEAQRKENATRIKDAKNQAVANNITGKFMQIMQAKDVTLQALLLQDACTQTENMNKLALRARREILSNSENHFYTKQEPINASYLSLNVLKSHNKTLNLNTILSKDGSVMVEVNEYGISINHKFNSFAQKLPPLLHIKLSPNGRYLYFQTLEKVTTDNNIYVASKSTIPKNAYAVLRLQDFKWVQDLTTVNQINVAAFSQSSDSLVLIQSDGQILINDLKRNKITPQNVIKSTIDKPITNLLLTHDGKKMLIGFGDGSVVLTNIKGKILNRFPLFHHNQIMDWDIAHNDKYIISGSADSTVLLWQIEGTYKAWGQHKFNNIVSSVSFSQDDSFSIASSFDNSIILKDKKGDNVAQIKGSNVPILSCGFKANGATIYTMDFLNLKTFDLKTTHYEVAPLDYWRENLPQILKGEMVFSKNNKYKIFKNTEGVSRVVENGKGEIFKFDSLTTYQFSPDDKYVLTIKKDSAIAWDLSNQKQLWNLKSKKMITNVLFSEAKFSNFLILENKEAHHTELWDLNYSIFNPKKIFDSNFKDPQFIANGSLLVNVNNKKTEIRRTDIPDTIIATIPSAKSALYFADKNDQLYAISKDEIKSETMNPTAKYGLYELNVKDKDKNDELQPSYYFDVPIESIEFFSFVPSGDSVLFKTQNEVLIYPNYIKLMNEKRYLPNNVLNIDTKRANKILTIEDCIEQKNLKDMTQCALFFAEAVVDDPSYLTPFMQVIEAMNIPNLNKKNLNKEDLEIWEEFDRTLTEIVGAYPYESHFNEKIKLTQQIIEIKENVMGDKESTQLATMYGNLCWYILFEDSLNKFQKAMIYGKKALELSPEDWIYANLGHAYLFTNDFENARIHYAFLLDRYNDLIKDFNVLEKADITHPRMKEMRNTLLEMANKPRK
jgi:WD40 repeat protein